MRDNETINTYDRNNYSWEKENGDTFSLINSYPRGNIILREKNIYNR